MSTRGARVVRGLVVAAVSLIVAAFAHIAGGGQIGAVGFAVALAFSVLASIGLTGRTVSRLRITIAVLFSQGVFHLLFGIGSGYQASAVTQLSETHMAGMGMAGMGSQLVSTLPAPAQSVVMPDNGWMWGAHALAAVITVLALVKGEKAFWYLTGRVCHSLERLFALPCLMTIEQPTMPDTVLDLRQPDARFLLAGMRHRGPPRLIVSS